MPIMMARRHRRLGLSAAIAVVCGTLIGAVRLRRFLGSALEGDPEVPTERGVVMAGSISSTVKLDYETGVAEKTYNHATRFVRLLYRLSFQAPSPTPPTATRWTPPSTAGPSPACSRSTGSARTSSRR